MLVKELIEELSKLNGELIVKYKEHTGDAYEVGWVT